MLSASSFRRQVWVTVLEVDLERKRISLSMKGDVNVDVDSSGDYAN